MRLLLLLFLFPLPLSATEIQIHQLGLTLHGLPTTGVAHKGMPRRIDEKGQLVVTPGLGIALIENQNIYSASILKDCFDNYASSLLVGRQFESKIPNLSYSFLLGVYLRELPMVCADGGCSLATDMPIKIRTKSLDIIPIAFGGLTYKIPLNEKNYFHTNLYTNFFITQFTVGFGFEF